MTPEQQALLAALSAQAHALRIQAEGLAVAVEALTATEPGTQWRPPAAGGEKEPEFYNEFSSEPIYGTEGESAGRPRHRGGKLS